jgi:hypothetical protein
MSDPIPFNSRLELRLAQEEFDQDSGVLAGQIKKGRN